MSKRTLYIIVGSIVLVIVLIGVGVFATVSTVASATVNKISTPTVVATTAPAHKGNGIGKVLKQYAPDIKNQIAQGLHLTPDQLTAQLQAGKTLSDIATAQKVSSTQLQTLVGNVVRSELQPAVDDGTLTQKQLDRLVKKYSTNPMLLDHVLGGKATQQATPAPSVQTTPSQ